MTSNSFATGSNQNCGNMMTDVPSTRVSAPPGGRSSVHLGGDDPDETRAATPCRREDEVNQSKLQLLKRGGCGQRKPVAEVEGSRPRVYRPSISLHAPPGGTAVFSPDWDPETEERTQGRKLYPGADGAGNNRDKNAIEALRYYQAPEKRVGKPRVEQSEDRKGDKWARDSHRYYLSSEVVVGKAHRVVEHRASSESTRDDEEWPEPSECDSLPLGAEWCSHR
jgi:hypothetical protein